MLIRYVVNKAEITIYSIGSDGIGGGEGVESMKRDMVVEMSLNPAGQEK